MRIDYGLHEGFFRADMLHYPMSEHSDRTSWTHNRTPRERAIQSEAKAYVLLLEFHFGC